MKKIIVAIALLLVATFALSVVAFGATETGAKTYYLGAPAKTAPKLDAEFGASEYVLSYTLDKADYVDAKNQGNFLVEAADKDSVTSSLKFGVSYDEENLYIGFEAAIDADVATAEYVVFVDDNGNDKNVDAEANETKMNVAFKQTADKAVGEIVLPLLQNGDDFGAEKKIYIVETTKNADNKILNVAKWNIVKHTASEMFELGVANVEQNTYVLGSEATLGSVVTVEQDPIGKPGDTAPVVTLVPVNTIQPETNAPETVAPETSAVVETKAPETKAPETKAPETKAPETTAPVVEEESGCGSSVTVMGIALVAALGTCAVVVSKKED